MSAVELEEELDRHEAYAVLCPLGAVMLWFLPDAGNHVQLEYGDPVALEYIDRVLKLHVGRYGQSLSLSSIEPVELMHYFDGEEYGIDVLPPAIMGVPEVLA